MPEDVEYARSIANKMKMIEGDILPSVRLCSLFVRDLVEFRLKTIDREVNNLLDFITESLEG